MSISKCLSMFAALTLTGCVTLQSGPSAPRIYFAMTDPHLSTMAPREQSSHRTLLLLPLQPDALADTRALVFSRARGEHGLYQFAAWTDRPSRMLLRLIQARLERRAVFASIATLGDGVRGDLVLGVRFERVVHDLGDSPHAGRVAFSAELIDRETRRLIARKQFTHAAPVTGVDAAAAATAINVALGAAVDALVQWIEEIAPS